MVQVHLNCVYFPEALMRWLYILGAKSIQNSSTLVIVVQTHCSTFRPGPDCLFSCFKCCSRPEVWRKPEEEGDHGLSPWHSVEAFARHKGNTGISRYYVRGLRLKIFPAITSTFNLCSSALFPVPQFPPQGQCPQYPSLHFMRSTRSSQGFGMGWQQCGC